MITVIPIVAGGLKTVPKCLEKEMEELEIKRRIETIQKTELFKSTRIPRELWRPEKTCRHSNPNKRPPPANVVVSNSLEVK